MARTQILTNNGETQYREARANGTNAVTVKAGATLAADIDFILPVSLPVAQEFLAIDSAGQLSTSAGASGTLDEAYDSGGAGVGRIITADTGPVELAGADGLRLNTTIPKIEFETDVAVFNWRIVANVAANDFRIQRGDQDADISDDTFDDIFLIDGSNRRVGIHALPVVDLDVNASGLGLGRVAAIRVGSEAGQDSSLQIFEDSTARWEIGYDDSAGGLAIGRQFINTQTVMFFEDVTGDIGIGEIVPDAKLHVTSTAATIAKLESTAADGLIVLVDSTTSDDTQVGIKVTGDAMALVVGAADLITGSGSLVTIAGKALVDQDGNVTGLEIDSEATGQPLLQINALATNTRGDLAFSGVRTADASGPAKGDIWWHGNDAALRAEIQGTGIVRTIVSQFGPGFGTTETVTITDPAGAALIVQRNVILAAFSGTADDLDTISPIGSDHFVGDTIVLSADAGDTITVKHNVGNIHLDGAADKVLVNGNRLSLMYDGTDWTQQTTMMVLL